MTRSIQVLGVVAMTMVLAACGEDARPVNIPTVPAGASEADCQRLCTLAPGDDACTAKHAEFCVASCRARTNGLASTCAACVISRGTQLAGGVDGFGDPFCSTGGPADLSSCDTECDDGGGVPAPELSALCELSCNFYMQDTTPLACSADGSADCRAGCTAAVAAQGRLCAQCLIEHTIPSRICINDDCDCEPFFDGDTGFGCMELCDTMLPT